MLTAKQVEEQIKRKGTKFATVKFIKKDGSERVINGLFRAAKHIQGNDGGRNNAVMKNHNLVPIYSLKDGGWRCFKKDSVVEIK